jgi:Arc/MetJ-type ribon-helix-helix transcriptional regulator
MSRQRVAWYLEVTEHLDKLLEEYIKRDAYKTKAEFIREAVREKLEREFAKLRKVKA